jgi:hypothetical protein
MSTLSQARICVQKFPPEDRALLREIHYGAQSDAHASRLKAALIVKKLWPPKSTVKISFLNNKKVPRTPSSMLGPNLDPLNNQIENLSSIDTVKKVVNERIKPIVNLNIQFVDKDGDIRVSFNENDGAWSTVGTDCFTVKDKNKPTMNLGWIDVPTIIHEFGHAIGSLIHEHQNPIGGNPIKWNKPKVYKWAEETQGWDKKTTDENIFDQYERNSLNGSVYDPLSIMLYFFPKEFTLNNKGTTINGRLSGYDTIWINDSYKINAPETPEQFYPRVYGESLKDALAQSRKASMEYKSIENYKNSKDNYNNNTNNSIFFKIIIIILVLLLLSLIIKNK